MAPGIGFGSIYPTWVNSNSLRQLYDKWKTASVNDPKIAGMNPQQIMQWGGTTVGAGVTQPVAQPTPALGGSGNLYGGMTGGTISSRPVLNNPLYTGGLNNPSGVTPTVFANQGLAGQGQVAPVVQPTPALGGSGNLYGGMTKKKLPVKTYAPKSSKLSPKYGFAAV